MEGNKDGEGIVAIVQGLRGAGLAGTLMGGRQRRRNGSIIAINQSNGVGRARSTVDTSTGALPLSTSKDTAAQICDDRYTSSYQMAHCRFRPSSPPVQLKEFPPQRPEPCRTQGNFEVGARKTQSPTPSSANRSQTFRNSYTSVDRSLFSNTRPSRCTESFAFSLRKYPNVSPNISTELVQRLLDYTQTRHFSKSSYHIKNTRLRRSRTESPKAIKIMKSSKYVQTYTRNRFKENVSKSKERVKENAMEDRKRRSQSPVMSSRDVRHKSKCIDASYDYLKSTSPRRFTTIATDVRYLTDMTRCLRDTLRQICDDQPVVCPNIQYRYSQHRRMHHRRDSQDDSPEYNSNYCPGGGSVRMVSIGIPAMSSCEAMAGTFLPVCPSLPKVCCYCQKPVPCNCPRKSSSDDDYANNVEEQAFEWLDELPVYANDTPQDRHIRQEMVKELAEQLKDLKDDKDFEEKAKKKIYECVSNMPMWLPGDKENQDLFKQQMADSLFDKINNITRNGRKFEKAIERFVDNLDLKTTDSQRQVIDKQSVVDNFVNRLRPLALNQPADSEEYKDALKSDIVEIMEGLPINVDGDKDAYIDNHADKLATELHKIPAKDIFKQSSAESLEDEFEKVIWKWVNDVPDFASGSASKIVDNQKSVKMLANKLKRLQAQGIDDSYVQEEMQNEINEWLENNVGSKPRLGSETKHNMAVNLVAKLVDASKSADNKKKTRIPLIDQQNAITQKVRDWLNNNPELSDGDEEENEKIVDELANKLLELRSQGKDDSEIEDEISDWLNTIFVDKGKRLNPRSRQRMTDELLNKINTVSGEPEDDHFTPDSWDRKGKYTSKDSERKRWDKQAKWQQPISDESASNLDEEYTKTAFGRTKDLRNAVKQGTQPSTSKARTATEDQLINNVKHDVGLILDDTNVPYGNRDQVESILTDVLADVSMRGEMDTQTKNKLIRALKDSGIPKDQIKEITGKVTERANELPLGYKSLDYPEKFSDTTNSRNYETLLPTQKEIFKESAKQEIGDFIQELTGDNNALSSRRNQAATEKLVQRVGDIMSQKDTTTAEKKDDVEREVSKYLQSISVDADPSQASKLADRLQNQAFKTSAPKRFSAGPSRTGYETLSPTQKDIFKDSAKREIGDFIQELTGDNNALSSRKNQAATEKLVQKVGDIMSRKDSTSADKKDAIEKEISKYFDSLPVDADQFHASELADRLQNQALNVATPRRSSAGRSKADYDTLSPRQKEVIRDSAKQEIGDFIQELTGDRSTLSSKKNQAATEKLAQRVSDIMSQNDTTAAEKRGDIESEVSKYLQSISVDADPSQASELADRLQNQAFKTSAPKRFSAGPSRKGYETLSPTQKDIFKDSAKREIGDFIQELTGDNNALSSRKNQAATEKLVQKVGDIMSRKDTTSADKKDAIEKEISKYFDSLPVDADQFHASELADRLQNQALNVATPRSSSAGRSKAGYETLLPSQKEIFKDSAKQEISDFIQELTGDRSILSSKKNQAATEKLAQRVNNIMSQKDTTSAEKTDAIEKEISKYFDSLPVDAGQSHASELADILQNQALNVATPRRSSAGRIKAGYENLLPSQKEMFKDSAKQEIGDFIQELTGDRSTLSSKKNQAATEKLAQRVSDIMSQNDTTAAEKRDDIESEVSKYLRNIPVDADESQVSELADRLQSKAFKTSTPKKSLETHSFRPQRDSKGSTISAIEPSSPYKKLALNKEEMTYLNKLTKVTDDWVNDLPLDLSSEDSKFKDDMVDDLSRDIIDRQKYLQLNPNVKTSDSEEELEHLKYQIFRWLNKLPNAKDVMPSMAKAKYLMDRIKNVPVPQLVNFPELVRRPNKRRESYIQYLSQELSSLENEIQKWIQAVPSKFYANNDENLHQQMVKDLAQLINQLNREDELTEQLFDDAVTDYLQKMLKEYDERYFKTLTEGLKGVLVNKTLISLSNQSLNSLLLDWLKEKAIYQKRTPSEQREQEKLMTELSKSLKDTLRAPLPSGEPKEEKMLDNIKTTLKRFPMESKLRLDEEFHDSTANDLLEYLKIHLLQNVTDLESSMHAASQIEEILQILEEWLDSVPLLNRKSSIENKKVESLMKEFAERLHQLMQQYPNSNKIVSNTLKEEIKKYFHQLPIEQAKKKDPQFVSDKIEELYNKILKKMTAREPINDDDLKRIIYDWGKDLPFKPGHSIEKSKPEVDKVAQKVKVVYSKAPADATTAVKPKLENEIKTFVKKLPLQKDKFKESTISDLTDQLHDYVQNTTTARPDLTTDSNASSGFKKAADVLYDSVADWCDKLPIDIGNTPEEKEKVKTLKQNITSKLINKIGHLNVNPEVFRDDMLYEELLNDEIDNLISTLPTSPELKKHLTAQKEKLIEKVKEAKAKTQDELAGPAYKQQLCDAISKTLPSQNDTTMEEQAPFEVLKDNVADAYINLRFAAVDEETKRKLKNKISDTINQFCDEYLQRHPSSPVDAKKLNRELYDVLQTVPDPNDETIKSQVEQVRTKDEINDWLKGVPLKEDESPIKKLQKNKIVNVLTKRLHDIEKEKESNPGLDVEEPMKKETMKWIKKLPLQPGKENKVKAKVDELINRLGNTEDSRRFSVSKIRHSTDTTTRGPSQGSIRFSPMNDRPADVHTPPGSKYLSQYVPPFPASTLSTEDRAHLNRIRDRNQPKQPFFQSPETQTSQYKDVSVNPIPLDAGSQTEVGPDSAKAIQSQITRSQATTTPSADFPPSGQRPGSPQVIVQEHYWGSPDSTMNNVPSGQGQPASYPGQSTSYPGQSSSYQSQSPLQPQQAPQFSWHQSPAIPPRFEPQPSSSSAPAGIFPSPDQTRMPQTYMPSNTPQQQWSTPPPYMSMPPQPPCASPPPCMSQSIPCQPLSTQPCPSAPPMPPCIMPTPSPQMHPSSINPPASPCIPQSPCMETPQICQPQIPPCTSRIPCNRSRRIPPCLSQERKQTRKPCRPPCYRNPEISTTSSPLDTGPEMDFRFGPKVTRLGSFDDVPCAKTCGTQSPRAKRSRESPDGDDWNVRFPEEGYWGTPLVRRRVRRSLRNPEAFVKERNEERCRCRERVITKCLERRPPTTRNSCQPDDDSINRCSKCCGAHCPHPSYLFFR